MVLPKHLSSALWLLAALNTAVWSHAATIVTFDARPLNKLNLAEPANAATLWDTLHCVGALQGLVNRDAPRFYLFYCREFGWIPTSSGSTGSGERTVG